MEGNEKTRPRVVIVGCGFGGLWAVRALAGAPVDVTVVDRNNFHTFYPLLYQVAAAEQNANDIAFPVREILREIPNAEFVLAEVRAVDFEWRVLHADRLNIPYDYLVLTTGSSTDFFGIPGAADYSFPLRTMDHAVVLRNHILAEFERAAEETNPEMRGHHMTFAIVGGGPTGVEFAGSVAELVQGPLRKDYRRLDVRQVRVILIEAGPTLLAGFGERLSQYTERRLRKLGVDVRLNAAVTEVSKSGVKLKDGSFIPSETVVWTAGVKGEVYDGTVGLALARRGQVKVLPTLQTPDHPEVYAVGDLAYWEVNGKPLPQIAPVACQQGTHAAKNILRQIAGQVLEPFRYFDRGQMAVIGRGAAVANLLGRWKFTGFLAWVMWLTIHIFYLVGARNRLFVIANWALDYFFYQRKVRLIIGGSSTAGAPVRPGETRAQAAHGADDPR